MFIVMVANECAPVAHAGGLGDVVFGLSRELELRGNAVEIVLPEYNSLRYDRVHALTVTHQDLWVHGIAARFTSPIQVAWPRLRVNAPWRWLFAGRTVSSAASESRPDLSGL